MYQMSIKYSNVHKIYRHFPIGDPENFSQIGIFGLKTNHLATLASMTTAKEGDEMSVGELTRHLTTG
jgi:hypothetical protein